MSDEFVWHCWSGTASYCEFRSWAVCLLCWERASAIASGAQIREKIITAIAFKVFAMIPRWSRISHIILQLRLTSYQERLQFSPARWQRRVSKPSYCIMTRASWLSLPAIQSFVFPRLLFFSPPLCRWIRACLGTSTKHYIRNFQAWMRFIACWYIPFRNVHQPDKENQRRQDNFHSMIIRIKINFIYTSQ